MGGSSGGGGGSGAVSYPTYMTDVHNDWLDNTGVDTITSSITDVMDAALGNSPFLGMDAYNPDADISSMISAEVKLQDLVTLLSSGTSLDALIANVLDDSHIDNIVTEFEADASARLVSTILPRFRRGMQDINAVVSSAFAIGESIIEAEQERNVNRFSAELHARAGMDNAIQVINLKLEYQKIASSMLVEIYRMKIVAKKEETDVNADLDDKDAKWDLEVFQYGANLLASIGGGTVSTKGPTRAQSVLGGALSGISGGAMIGGEFGSSGWGGIIGGILGAASGLL